MIISRYIFREFFKTFAFFLFGFYFLYVLIDYSTHMQDFMQGKSLSIWKITFYYLLQFIKRADILLPLATLIAGIKLLCGLNSHKELVAFQAAGVRAKTLLRPLFFVATLSCVFTLAVNEYVAPYSLNFIDNFYDSHLRHSFRGNRTDPLRVMHLSDHSKLIYQSYDASKEAFFDVIWLRTPDDFYRMRYLKADPNCPVGEHVDHLQRGETGAFEKTESYVNYLVPDLNWSNDLPRKGFIPFENQAISELYSQLKNDHLLSNFNEKGVLTHFLFKLVMPFFSLLILFAIAPGCLRYTRDVAIFLIYTLSLFGFVAFVALMDSAVILGENAALSPYIAVLAPFLLLFGFFGWRYVKA